MSPMFGEPKVLSRRPPLLLVHQQQRRPRFDR
jgi:hypothetical protein